MPTSGSVFRVSVYSIRYTNGNDNQDTLRK